MAEIQSDQVSPNYSQVIVKKCFNMWKFITVILIVILIGLVAYEFGKGQFILPKTSMISPTITPIQETATVSATITPTGSITPTTTIGKKVSAGVKNQIFSTYTIVVPSGWTDDHTTNTAGDTLTITKGQYVLTISQGSGGSGSCIYPGDTAQPMAQTFSNFVGITGIFSQFRRGTSDNKIYTVCEQKSGGFTFPTSVGYITYEVPVQADQAMLAEMDGMVASLTK